MRDVHDKERVYGSRFNGFGLSLRTMEILWRVVLLHVLLDEIFPLFAIISIEYE
jgi:hypothetical protein